MSPASSTSSSRQTSTSQMRTHAQQENESEPSFHHVTPCRATAVRTAMLEPVWVAGHTQRPHKAKDSCVPVRKEGAPG